MVCRESFVSAGTLVLQFLVGLREVDDAIPHAPLQRFIQPSQLFLSTANLQERVDGHEFKRLCGLNEKGIRPVGTASAVHKTSPNANWLTSRCKESFRALVAANVLLSIPSAFLVNFYGTGTFLLLES